MATTKNDIAAADIRIGDTISYNLQRNAKRSVGKVLEIKVESVDLGGRTMDFYVITTDASYLTFCNIFADETVRLIERAPVEVPAEVPTVATSRPQADAAAITATAKTMAPGYTWTTRKGTDDTYYLRISSHNVPAIDAHLELLGEMAELFDTGGYNFDATVHNLRSGFATPSYGLRIVDLAARQARVDEQEAKRKAAIAKALAEIEAATPTDANGVPVLFEV